MTQAGAKPMHMERRRTDEGTEKEGLFKHVPYAPENSGKRYSWKSPDNESPASKSSRTKDLDSGDESPKSVTNFELSWAQFENDAGGDPFNNLPKQFVPSNVSSKSLRKTKTKTKTFRPRTLFKQSVPVGTADTRPLLPNGPNSSCIYSPRLDLRETPPSTPLRPAESSLNVASPMAPIKASKMESRFVCSSESNIDYLVVGETTNSMVTPERPEQCETVDDMEPPQEQQTLEPTVLESTEGSIDVKMAPVSSPLQISAQHVETRQPSTLVLENEQELASPCSKEDTLASSNTADPPSVTEETSTLSLKEHEGPACPCSKEDKSLTNNKMLHPIETQESSALPPESRQKPVSPCSTETTPWSTNKAGPFSQNQKSSLSPAKKQPKPTWFRSRKSSSWIKNKTGPVIRKTAEASTSAAKTQERPAWPRLGKFSSLTNSKNLIGFATRKTAEASTLPAIMQQPTSPCSEENALLTRSQIQPPRETHESSTLSPKEQEKPESPCTKEMKPLSTNKAVPPSVTLEASTSPAITLLKPASPCSMEKPSPTMNKGVAATGNEKQEPSTFPAKKQQKFAWLRSKKHLSSFKKQAPLPSKPPALSPNKRPTPELPCSTETSSTKNYFLLSKEENSSAKSIGKPQQLIAASPKEVDASNEEELRTPTVEPKFQSCASAPEISQEKILAELLELERFRFPIFCARSLQEDDLESSNPPSVEESFTSTSTSTSTSISLDRSQDTASMCLELEQSLEVVLNDPELVVPLEGNFIIYHHVRGQNNQRVQIEESSATYRPVWRQNRQRIASGPCKPTKKPQLVRSAFITPSSLSAGIKTPETMNLQEVTFIHAQASDQYFCGDVATPNLVSPASSGHDVSTECHEQIPDEAALDVSVVVDNDNVELIIAAEKDVPENENRRPQPASMTIATGAYDARTERCYEIAPDILPVDEGAPGSKSIVNTPPRSNIVCRQAPTTASPPSPVIKLAPTARKVRIRLMIDEYDAAKFGQVLEDLQGNTQIKTLDARRGTTSRTRTRTHEEIVSFFSVIHTLPALRIAQLENFAADELKVLNEMSENGETMANVEVWTKEFNPSQ